VTDSKEDSRNRGERLFLRNGNGISASIDSGD
jgi:hypothetical protein